MPDNNETKLTAENTTLCELLHRFVAEFGDAAQRSRAFCDRWEATLRPYQMRPPQDVEGLTDGDEYEAASEPTPAEVKNAELLNVLGVLLLRAGFIDEEFSQTADNAKRDLLEHPLPPTKNS